MSKYKIGEKIAFYNDALRRTGKIVGIKETHYVVADLDKDPYCWHIHEKQIRRLKPKMPLRTFWLNMHGPSDPDQFHISKEEAENSAYPSRIECIEVREVRKKK